MIKFVCSSCGERLSVPDAQAGKKSVCPTCMGVNRIPLKGYVPAQPGTPAAPSGGSPSIAPAAAKRPQSIGPLPALTQAIPPPGARETPLSIPLPGQDGDRVPVVTPPMTRRPRKERTLPRPVKIVLLVLAALAIVGALWLALYVALRWAVRTAGSP